MKTNIKLSISKLTAIALLALLRNVIAKMTGNPHFPSPVVPLATMTASADQLEAAIEVATKGSLQSKLERDKIAQMCRDQLRQQADHVRSIALGDAAILGSSGFLLVKKREPVGIPGIPTRMEARTTGLGGQLELRWGSVRGARGYQMWMSELDPSTGANWKPLGFTARVSHLVTDLTPFKAYYFCVSAVGVSGEGAQSDPAMGRASA